MPIEHLHFNSTLEYARLCEQKLVTENYQAPSWSAWGDKTRHRQGVCELYEGTNAYNSEIERITRLAWENIPSLQKTWKLETAGAFPSVPAHLAGEPEAMWHMRNEHSERSPLRIWVGVTSSAGIDEGTLARRGAALAAFAAVLSELRPVYLTPFTCNTGGWSGNDGLLISYDIMTSPLVYAEIGANLASAAVTRYVGLSVGYTLNSQAHGGSVYIGDENGAKKYLGVNEQDLYLPSIHLYDELLTDPIKWIKEHIAKYAEARDAEMSW